MTNEPLFRSGHDALVFAYNYSSQQYGKSPMIKITGTPVSAGKGLSGIDGAAQAGMIRLEVSQLGRLKEAALISRFAPSYVLCNCGKSCCTGRKPNDEWTHAIAVLSQHLKEVVLFGCTTTIDMRVHYLKRFFLPKHQRLSLDDLAKRHSITKRTVVNHISLVKGFLFGNNDNRKNQVGVEESALRMIEDILFDKGLILQCKSLQM